MTSTGVERAVCLVAALAFALLISAVSVSEAVQSVSDLQNLTASNEDARINDIDLAFVFITHDFDAVPKDGYVIVRINATIYKLTPNGEKPGLADIVAVDRE